MEELKTAIMTYKNKYKLNDKDCATNLNLTEEQLQKVIDGSLKLEEKEQNRVMDYIQSKTKSTSRRIVKILELIFRFVAMIMPLTALLLCINGYTHTNAIIVILSIGVIASSMMTLPRNENK